MALATAPVALPPPWAAPARQARPARAPEVRAPPSVRLSTAALAGAVGLAAARGSRRVCRRAGPARVGTAPAEGGQVADPDLYDKLELELQQRHGVHVGEPGVWMGAFNCPVCNGGRTRERACSLMRLEDGSIRHHCWRGKCGVNGVARSPAAVAARAARAPSSRAPARPAWAPAPAPAPRDPAQPFVPTSGQRELGPRLHEYLVVERGIPEEVLARNGVKEATLKNNMTGSRGPTIVFTYLQGGEPVAEKLRALPKVFWQARYGASTLYGADDLEGHDTVILVEGELDKLSVEAAGLTNVASLQNGAPGGLPPVLPEALQAASKVVLAVDADEAGQEGAKAITEVLGEDRCWWVTWRDGCKDANEVLLRHGPDAVREDIEAAAPPRPPAGCMSLSAYQPECLQRMRGEIPEEWISGYSSGWENLNEVYRVVPGELSVITGVPGSGKSEWLLSLLVNLIKTANWRVMIFSFETPRRSLTMQLLEKYHDLPRERLEELDLEQSFDWLDRHVDFGSAPFDSPTIEAVLERAREQAATGEGLHGLVIDPYNYLTRPAANKGFETQYISEMLAKVKRFAAETKCHVWIVAHPAKANSWTNATPSLYDIAGSSNWFNKCDMGVIVHRLTADTGVPVLTPTAFTKVSVDKCRNRNAGQRGEAFLHFDYGTRRYSEASFDEMDVQGLQAEVLKVRTPS